MKKTIPTSIARTLFHIEEDAYKELETYLSSIRAHFNSYPDSKEIIEDIESRIAEKFIEFTGGQLKTTDRIVSLEHIKKLIISMGSPSDFGDETYTADTETSSDTKEPTTKKLYRDTENAIIAGVSSGLAAYFGIDPIIPRILFVVSIFFGGGGIIIYLILWLIIPEAKTTTQKLEMRGDPVTLETVSNVVKKKVDEVKTHKGTIRKIIEIPLTILKSLILLLTTRIIPVVGKILGALLSLAAGIASIILISLLLIVTINPAIPLFDFPLIEIFSYSSYYLFAILSFLIVTIPILCIGALGSLLMGKRSSLFGTFGGILIGFWMIAVVGGIVTVATHASQFEQLQKTQQAYENKTRTITLEPFSKLHAQNNVQITVVVGTTTSATIRGNEKSVTNVIIENSNGTLLLQKNSKERFCIFCSHRPLYATVTVPSLDSITAENGSIVDFKYSSTTSLSLTAVNASRINYLGVSTALDVHIENGSKIEASGSSLELTVNTENGSSFLGEKLNTKKATVQINNGSKADIFVSETLLGTASNGSTINQFGPATVANSVAKNASKIETISSLEQKED